MRTIFKGITAAVLSAGLCAIAGNHAALGQGLGAISEQTKDQEGQAKPDSSASEKKSAPAAGAGTSSISKEGTAGTSSSAPVAKAGQPAGGAGTSSKAKDGTAETSSSAPAAKAGQPSGDSALRQSSGYPGVPSIGNWKIPDSLDDMVMLAMRANPEIAVAEAKIRQAEAQLQQARAERSLTSVKITQEILGSQRKREKLREQLKVSKSNFEKGIIMADAVIAVETELLDVEDRLRVLLGWGQGFPSGMMPGMGMPGGGLGAMMGSGGMEGGDVMMGAMGAMDAGGGGMMGGGMAGGMPGGGGGMRGGKASASKATADMMGTGKGTPSADMGKMGKMMSGMMGGGKGGDEAPGGMMGVVMMGGLSSPKKPTIPKQIEEALDKKIECNFEETPFQEVMTFFNESTKIEILIDQNSLDDMNFSTDQPITLRLKNQTLRNVLTALTDRHRGIYFVVRDYGLLVTSEDRARELGLPVIPELPKGQDQSGGMGGSGGMF